MQVKAPNTPLGTNEIAVYSHQRASVKRSRLQLVPELGLPKNRRNVLPPAPIDLPTPCLSVATQTWVLVLAGSGLKFKTVTEQPRLDLHQLGLSPSIHTERRLSG